MPDPALAYDEATGRWHYTEPDWDELRSVVTGHGPMSQERLAFRRHHRDETQWVRDAVLGPVRPPEAARTCLTGCGRSFARRPKGTRWCTGGA